MKRYELCDSVYAHLAADMPVDLATGAALAWRMRRRRR